MKKLILFSIICIFSAGAVSAMSIASTWLPNFEDIPQMDKIYVIEDDGLIFSTPDGKIIQTTIASDTITRRQFQRFYRDALYELGWKKIKDKSDVQVFTRGSDELTIEILDTDPLSARFILTPKE